MTSRSFSLPSHKPPTKGNANMSVAKIIEISSDSKTSFQDAIESGLKRAEETLKNVKGAWIAEQKVSVSNGQISSYRVIMRVSFVID
jgi:flavin-binding protein dodecin